MDMKARQRLIDEIAAQKAVGGEIAVPLGLFFDGNDDQGSIGPNLGDRQPTIRQFYETLSSLRDRSEVQDIWVRIYDVNEDSWPYTDTVYVLSSLPQDEVENALKVLGFDEVVPEWMYRKPAAAPEPKLGFAAYSVWWD